MRHDERVGNGHVSKAYCSFVVCSIEAVASFVCSIASLHEWKSEILVLRCDNLLSTVGMPKKKQHERNGKGLRVEVTRLNVENVVCY